jgi:hypothetical protein
MFKRIRRFIRAKLGIEENRKLLREIYWGQIFDYAIKDSKWLIQKNFNAGRWALGFPALYILYRILNDVRPKSIIEFGLGESSKMTYQYLRSFSDTQLLIIEQDQEWLDFFMKEVFDVKEIVKILPVNKINVGGFESNVYSNLTENISSQKYDFVLIDGPFGSRHNSRSQLIEIIDNDLLETDFVILLDDYERMGEKETATLAMNILDKKKIKYHTGVYQGRNDTWILCCEKYQFLKSL